MIPSKFIYCSMSARLPSREDPLFEMAAFSIVCMITSAHLTEKLPFLSFALLAWVLLFNFLAFAFFRYSDKLNALCDCFDAPVTDWPPMSLDHFKWVVWNCELRGREITQEDAREYFVQVMDDHLRYGTDYFSGKKIAASFGRFAGGLPSHSELRFREIDSVIKENRNGYHMAQWEINLGIITGAIARSGVAVEDIKWSFSPKSEYELIEELLPATPVKLPQSRM
jgi:hypothetical protein